MPILDPQKLIANRVAAIRDYHRQVGIPKAELDVSGGVDSAVVLGLLTKALGPENVAAVYSSINSSPESLVRAREVCKVFGVTLLELDLSEVFEAVRKVVLGEIMFKTATPEDWAAVLDKRLADLTIDGGFRSCFRASVGRYVNRLMGGIRHGTGNEDEDRWLRFYQKGGDGEVDTNPIEMLSKGEVWQLAIALGVPESILKARPTPDLWGTGETAHTDEAEIRKYLGLEKFPLLMYSVIDFRTGKYVQPGFIERINRLLDKSFAGRTGEEILFNLVLNQTKWWDILNYAENEFFKDLNLSCTEILKAFEAVRKAERCSRHKQNNNIPMLGTRAALLAEKILTNELEFAEVPEFKPITDRPVVGFPKGGFYKE